MKKVLTLALIAAVNSGCSIDSDGDFVSSGADSNGSPGYSSSPAYIDVKIASKDKLDCTVKYTNLDTNEIFSSFDMNTTETYELEVISDDHLFRLDSVCDGEFIDPIEFNTLGSHYLGVDQSITLSGFTNLATAYYDFFASNTDIEGQRDVFIQAAKKYIAEFFGIDDINTYPEFESLRTNSINTLDNDVKHAIFLDALMTLHTSVLDDISVKYQHLNNLMINDLSADGKLDGQSVSIDEVEDLILSGSNQSYDIDTYTYVNDYLSHIAHKYSFLMNDQDVRSSFFNILDSRNTDRGRLLRNDDIQLLDTEAPVITGSTYENVDGVVKVTAIASDDLLISRLNISFNQNTFDLKQQNSDTWVVYIDLQENNLLESDFLDYDLTARDYSENITTENF